MNTKTQYLCLACGAGFVVLMTLGWMLVAGLVPPTLPSLNAAGVAEFYRENTGSIRLGTLFAMTAAALTIPWIALIAVHMRRCEGEFPVLTITQVVAGAAELFALILPFTIWTAAAFRPERAAELTLLYSDLGWILFIMTFPPFTVQLVAIGLAIMSDKNKQPIFPRWIGYFNIWVAVLFIPGGLITFFKTGPFAWNGLLAFWMPVVVFFGWYIVMFFALMKIIRVQAAQNFSAHAA